MTDFLANNGGGSDYGKFASTFMKVKRRQLESHFDVVEYPAPKGLRIELQYHPDLEDHFELQDSSEMKDRPGRDDSDDEDN